VSILVTVAGEYPGFRRAWTSWHRHDSRGGPADEPDSRPGGRTCVLKACATADSPVRNAGGKLERAAAVPRLDPRRAPPAPGATR
jgi:hypothetical protein